MKNKITLVILGGLLLGVIAWYTLAGREEAPGLLEEKPVAAGQVSVEERAILDTLFQLRAIELSGTIFNSPTFNTLRDFRTEIVAEPIGRRNPFAPLAPDTTVPASDVE